MVVSVLSIWDILVTPFYVLMIFIYCTYVKKNNVLRNSAYQFYTMGMLVKIFCAIAICLVYTVYYSSGDSTGYYEQGVAICNLMFKKPAYFFEVLFEGCTAANYSYLDDTTTYVAYNSWVNDHSAMYITRLIVPLIFPTLYSFVSVTILLAAICYSGIWRLYLLFCEQFPAIKKELAIAILFIPSVAFWGSGLLKDTITLSAVGWYSYAFYKVLIQKRYKITYIIAILLSAYLLISLKPYILFALLPGSLIWLSYDRISKTKNQVVRFIIAPLLIAGGLFGGFYALSSLGGVLGVYKVETILERAVVVQKDLKSSYYGGNSFDIGDFDASIGSVLGKAPQAINASLFRPYLWEVRNPLMLLSAAESTYIMLLTIALMFRLKMLGFFRFIWENPLLLFSVLFSLFFAFSVGLSTPNFGALSRLKIPCIPFFVASLFVMRHLYEKKTKKKLGL